MPKAMSRAADRAEQPAAPLTERATRSATEQLEVAVHRRQRLALGVAEDQAAPDQEPAERHDERRHADVGDDEPLDGRRSPAPRAIPTASATIHVYQRSNPRSSDLGIHSVWTIAIM